MITAFTLTWYLSGDPFPLFLVGVIALCELACYAGKDPAP